MTGSLNHWPWLALMMHMSHAMKKTAAMAEIDEDEEQADQRDEVQDGVQDGDGDPDCNP